uniref:Uncharacterized protein n=1 Tax=Arundo donax TaxID=35708 RepID=A0A0A8Z3U2_ARUDO
MLGNQVLSLIRLVSVCPYRNHYCFVPS